MFLNGTQNFKCRIALSPVKFMFSAIVREILDNGIAGLSKCFKSLKIKIL